MVLSIDYSFLGTGGLFVLAVLIVFTCYAAVNSPARRVPGPLLPRLNRLWEFYHASRGDLHIQTVELHKRYGMFKTDYSLRRFVDSGMT